MSEALEWTKLILGTLMQMASLAFSVGMLFIFYRAFRLWMGRLNPTLNRSGIPKGRYLMRRLFCHHRHVSRVRDSYGRNYTGCTRCGEDVNQGKAREEWR